MKLTVITVNLNNKEGLVKTVDSVLAQSFQGFEYIIVDGGSQDGSLEFILDTAVKYPGLIWTSEPDTGVFNAMNKGILRATGDYLLFLNSGDFFVDKDVLWSVFAQEHSADILLGISRVSEHGKTVWRTTPKSEYTLNDFYHGSIAHQASFIKKRLFTEFGLYREDLRFMGDWEFFLRTLVYHNCSVEPLSIIISDYNLGGLSSDSANKAKMEQEKAVVYSDYHWGTIIRDYKAFDQFKEQNKAMRWAWNKVWIRKPIELLYKSISYFKGR